MLKEHVGSIDFKVKGCVLIIVLMEHAQRIRQEFVYDRRYYVLILILMEHAQRECLHQLWAQSSVSLNPCFSGTCSTSLQVRIRRTMVRS